MKSKKNIEKWYEEELNKRDEAIRKLKEENELLLKTSLRQADKNQEIRIMMEKIIKKKK